MIIHLLRHGKTLANEKKLYCGHTDLPLSENGIAELNAQKNQNIYPAAADIFFTSGLVRAGQTVCILYGPDSPQMITIQALAEYNFGQFEMKSYDELKHQADYQAWITDETGDVKCPGGESKNQVQKRVVEGYLQIVNTMCQAGHNSAIVACHGGTIVSVMELLFPNTKNFYEWQPKPGRGYTISYAKKAHPIYTPI